MVPAASGVPDEHGAPGDDPRTISTGTDDGGRPAFVLAFGGSRPVRILVRAISAAWSKARSQDHGTQVWTVVPSILIADQLLTLASTHGCGSVRSGDLRGTWVGRCPPSLPDRGCRVPR
ncbi:MAG: hypothetical protein EBT09_00330 [Actinobacteria bacterium]|nr:hypothetical protein [Actinomycetota bacterium]